MPNTESNLPMLMASSCESNGMKRPKACSRNGRVSSPREENRGRICSREKISSGAPGVVYLKSKLTVLIRNDGRPPIPTDRGKNPLVSRPPGSFEATSPRELTAGANGSTA